MNLYQFHSDPELLPGYEQMYEIVPELVWKKYSKITDELQKRKHILAREPAYAYKYARHVLRFKRFYEGEPAIASEPGYAFLYAVNIIKERFPEGEAAIATDPYFAYHYAKEIMKGRFLEGEKVIDSSFHFSELYQNYLRSLE